jgi:hypothetical protein
MERLKDILLFVKSAAVNSKCIPQNKMQRTLGTGGMEMNNEPTVSRIEWLRKALNITASELLGF